MSVSFTCPVVSSRLLSPIQMARLVASVGLIAFRCSALSPCRLIVKMIGIGATNGPLISHVLQAGALVISLFNNYCEPDPDILDHSLRRSLSPALQSDQRSRRPTDQLQIFSWNLGQARGSVPRLLARRLDGPRHTICELEGYVMTQHHCTVLSNKDTFARGLLVHALHGRQLSNLQRVLPSGGPCASHSCCSPVSCA